jgi:hypothetical protein
MRYYLSDGRSYELLENGVRCFNRDGSYFMTMSFWGFESYYGFDPRKV